MAATGQPVWADPSPSYEQLLERIAQSPASQEAGALQEAAARALQARARPNPVIGLETGNVLGSGIYSGFNNAETTLSVSQDLELWGRRSVRMGAARAEADAATVRRDLAVTEAAARLATVVIGGLITATLLTLIVLPTFAARTMRYRPPAESL